MKGNVLLIILLFVGSVSSLGQISGCTDTEANNYDPQATEDDGLCTFGPLLEIFHEEVYTGDGSFSGYPEGGSTYRIYARLEEENDYVNLVFADDDHDLWIGSSTGELWNHESGSLIGADLDASLFGSEPVVAYDSFITVGSFNNESFPDFTDYHLSSQPSGSVLSDALTTSPWGSNIELEDGYWTSSNPGQAGSGQGEDNIVLIAQVTCVGEPQYHVNLEVVDGDSEETWIYVHANPEGVQQGGDLYGLSSTLAYCFDPDACNYNANGHPGYDDPIACDYSCIGCGDPDAINYDPEVIVNAQEQCIYSSCSGELLIIEMLDSGANGWQGATYTFYDQQDMPIAAGSLINGQANSDTLCLITGCFKIVVEEGNAPEEVSWTLSNIFGESLLSGGVTTTPLFSDYFGSCPPTGCTNDLANNYNPSAIMDDGSCEDDNIGCTDNGAINFNPQSLIDDGSCVFDLSLVGCTDPFAANYWPAAIYDDGSNCIYGDFRLRIEEVESAPITEGYPEYHDTYRIYLETEDSLNFVSSVIATPNLEPVSITTVGPNDTAIWNSTSGSYLAPGLNFDLFEFLPLAEWDSYVSIGMEHSQSPGNMLADSDPDEVLLESFLGTAGSDLIMEVGSWIPIIPWENGFAGPEQEVLLAQVTSPEGVCATMNFEVNANSPEAEQFLFHEMQACSWPYFGCTNPIATNYNPLAQVQGEDCIYSTDYGIQVVVDYSDDGSIPGYPAGYSTYSIYATCQNSQDKLLEVFADKHVSPIVIESSCDIWNHEFGGWMQVQVDDNLYASYPALAYDSHVTIGESEEGNSNIEWQNFGPIDDFPDDVFLPDAFQNNNSEGVHLTDFRLTAPCESENSLGGDFFKVKIAQITTNGQISGSVNLRYALFGDCDNLMHLYDVPFSSPAIEGCTDPVAENYNECASVDNGSCSYAPCTVTSAELTWNCYWDAEEEIYIEGFDFSAEFSGLCDQWAIVLINTTNQEQVAELSLLDMGIEVALGYTFFVPVDLDIGVEYFANITYDQSSTNALMLVNPCGSIPGCTDPLASNYLPEATWDDGSCEFNNCVATDLSAEFICEYVAEEDSVYSGIEVTASWVGPCVIDEVCLISLSPSFEICESPSNFDIEILNGQTTYVPLQVAFDAQFELTISVVVGEFTLDVPVLAVECIGGCTDENALNYDPLATFDIGSCEYFDCQDNMVYIQFDANIWADEISWNITNDVNEVLYLSPPYEPLEFHEDSVCVADGCVTVNMFDSGNDGWYNSTYSLILPDGTIHQNTIVAGSYTFDIVGINDESCDHDGCTDPTAENFDPWATIDDGSCFISGESLPGSQLLEDDKPQLEIVYDGDFPSITTSNLIIGKRLTVYIYNMNGSVVYFDQLEIEDPTAPIPIQENGLTSGIYFIQVISEGKASSAPLILID